MVQRRAQGVLPSKPPKGVPSPSKAVCWNSNQFGIPSTAEILSPNLRRAKKKLSVPQDYHFETSSNPPPQGIEMASLTHKITIKLPET